MNVSLIGYRGVGKTTVSHILAKRWGWSAFDTDEEIERRAGKTIAAIFADEGEETFRDLEAAVVADAVKRDHCVLSLGGGAILRSASRASLIASGPVVWLQADAETIHRRIVDDAATAERRPDLTDDGGLEEIRRLLKIRQAAYREAATIEVATAEKSPEMICDEISAALAGTAP